MIRLNVFIQVKESNREEVLTLAKELVAASQHDEGCVAYDVFESATRPDVLMICETWTDGASLAVHSKTTHYTSLVPQIEKMAALKMEKFDF